MPEPQVHGAARRGVMHCDAGREAGYLNRLMALYLPTDKIVFASNQNIQLTISCQPADFVLRVLRFRAMVVVEISFLTTWEAAMAVTQLEREEHVHVWIEPETASAARRTGDAPPPRSVGRFRCSDGMGLRSVPARDRRTRDQEDPDEEEEGGKLVCRLIEDRDGNFVGHDGDGNALVVKRGSDGALSVYRGNGADAADPAIVGEHPGIGGDPAHAAKATGDAMARFARTQRPEHHMGALADYQQRLDDYYRR